RLSVRLPAPARRVVGDRGRRPASGELRGGDHAARGSRKHAQVDRASRELRNLTRYRKAQIEERTRETQRLDKVLQDAGIKLSSVASDVMGVSGQTMLRALVAGERDPEALAELARGTLRKKLPALREALLGRFSRHHALLVGEILAKLDYLE